VKRYAALGVFAVVAVAVLAFVQLGKPAWLERLQYPLDYKAIVRAHAHNYRLQPALLAAVIYQESKFNSDAKSSSGAIGLMQLQPATAEGIALRTGGAKFTTNDLYDPEINIRYGSWYLANLFHKYGDERLVLAAYNAGQGNVDHWRAEGRPIAFSETRAYVARVEHLKDVYRDAWHL
jgi:soluble lytic murein transglycosylase